jgi:hypothetical protein
MKFRHAILPALAAAISLAGAAHASTVDLGATYVGETGTIPLSSNVSGLYGNTIIGALPQDSEITFKYTFTGLISGALFAEGSYNFNGTAVHYYGSSEDSSTGIHFSQGYTTPKGSASPISATSSLVLTAANLSGATGSASITNDSTGNANFLVLLLGLFARGGHVAITYAVSAVPLPASALLFGLGLALLAGIGAIKRKRIAKTCAQ